MSKAEVTILYICVSILILVLIPAIAYHWKCYLGKHDIEFRNNVNGNIPVCKRCGKIIR